MELDTGASVSLISEDTWTRARLFTYTDKVVGATNGKIADLPPVVQKHRFWAENKLGEVKGLLCDSEECG